MSIFPRPARPKALIADVKRVWNSSTSRYKLVFGVAALAVNSIIVTGFVVESRWGVLPEGPQITYAEDFPANRTDEQIKQDQWKDARERRALADERQRQWKKVDDALSSYGF
jgi:hypothetical protein